MIDAATFVTTTFKLGGGVLPTFYSSTIKEVSTQQWSNLGKPVLDILLHRTLFSAALTLNTAIHHLIGDKVMVRMVNSNVIFCTNEDDQLEPLIDWEL